jgi:CubicO group peptidase (beta-lactamase class C family)
MIDRDHANSGFAERLARLDADMQQLVDRHERAGIAYGVVLDGRIVALAGVGMRDRAAALPMTPTSIVRLFSMTRAITSAAFLTLIEQGLVSLSDPVARFLPAFGDTHVLRSPDGAIGDVVPQDRPITIEMLLNYTSGLGYPFQYRPGEQPLMTDIIGHARSTGEGIDRLARLPLFDQPGTRWRYGFSGDVLGRIAEVVSGQPFDAFLRERVLDPLGMVDTGFWVPPADIDRLAKAYGPVGDDPLADVDMTWRAEYGAFDRPIAFLSGGGGLASTTEDYLRFVQMLLDDGMAAGTLVLAAESVTAMLTGHVPLAPGLAYRPHARFGYGLAVLDPEAERPFGVATQEATWEGLANTVFYIDRQHRLGAVGMTQYFGEDPDLFTRTFRNAVYRLITP